MAEETKLYPTFDIPASFDEASDEEAEVFGQAPLFDFEMGDMVKDGTNRPVVIGGKDTYLLWCLKMLQTQLGACESYPDMGIDYEDCIAQPNREAVQSAFERTITEALMKHKGTERVYSFSFEWEADALRITFAVKPRGWDEIAMTMETVVG